MSHYTIREFRDAAGMVRAVVLPLADGATVIPPAIGRDAYREAEKLGAGSVLFACRVWIDDPKGWRFQTLAADGTVSGWETMAPEWLRPHLDQLQGPAGDQ